MRSTAEFTRETKKAAAAAFFVLAPVPRARRGVCAGTGLRLVDQNRIHNKKHRRVPCRKRGGIAQKQWSLQADQLPGSKR